MPQQFPTTRTAARAWNQAVRPFNGGRGRSGRPLLCDGRDDAVDVPDGLIGSSLGGTGGGVKGRIPRIVRASYASSGSSSEFSRWKSGVGYGMSLGVREMRLEKRWKLSRMARRVGYGTVSALLSCNRAVLSPRGILSKSCSVRPFVSKGNSCSWNIDRLRPGRSMV